MIKYKFKKQTLLLLSLGVCFSLLNNEKPRAQELDLSAAPASPMNNSASTAVVPPVSANGIVPITEDASVTNIVAPNANQNLLQEKTTIDYRGAPLEDVILHLTNATKINVTISPAIGAKALPVTIRLTDVTYERALSEVLKLYQCGTILENGILRIDKIENIRKELSTAEYTKQGAQLREPARTIIWHLNYANATEVGDLLLKNLAPLYSHLIEGLENRDAGGAKLQGGKLQITPDTRSNKLMVFTIPEVHARIKSIIENLDKPEQQVSIEARIIEAGSAVSRALEVKWGGNFGGAYNGLNTGLLFPNSILGSYGGPALAGAGSTATLTPNAGTIGLSFGSLNGIINLDAVLKAFESESQVNVVASPNITVRNNGKASFNETFTLSYIVKRADAFVEMTRQSVILLEVTPKIGSDNLVSMDMVVKRDLEPTAQAEGTTTMTSREAKTTLTVRSGETAVIGGLYQTKRDKQQQRIPLLSKIPIIGALFRSDTDSAIRSEVMILVTPRIVNVDGGSVANTGLSSDMSSFPTNAAPMATSTTAMAPGGGANAALAPANAKSNASAGENFEAAEGDDFGSNNLANGANNQANAGDNTQINVPANAGANAPLNSPLNSPLNARANAGTNTSLNAPANTGANASLNAPANAGANASLNAPANAGTNESLNAPANNSLSGDAGGELNDL